MGFLDRILKGVLGPRHSIVIAFDHVDLETLEEITSAIDEISEIYRLSRLSEVAAVGMNKRRTGLAAIVFRNARVSVFLRALPELKERGIPFSLLLDTDCIGTNRLPVGEELEIYRQAFPEKGRELGGQWLERAWHEGRSVDSLREELRSEFGPLPVDRLDPTRFFATWGRIVELRTEVVEFGMSLNAVPSSEAARTSADYARKSTNRPISFAFSPHEIDSDTIASLGFQFALTTRGGVVSSGTSLWEIPLFPLERHEPAPKPGQILSDK